MMRVLDTAIIRDGKVPTNWEQSFIVRLFDLILYVPSTIFQLNKDRFSRVEPVLARINVSYSRTTMQ